MSKKKDLVIFAPNWSKNNPYQNLLADSISDKYEVKMQNYPAGLRPFTSLHKQNPNMTVLHLHWVAELIHRLSWSKSSLFFYIKLGLMLFDLWRLKKSGIKVIWTIHNKLSHQGLNKKRELLIRRQFCRLADQIIIHSTEAMELVTKFYEYPLLQKTKVIFHGNYDNCYPKPSATKDSLRKSLNIKPDVINILYFGSIRPYKGVDNLIDCFNSIESTLGNSSLTLAGGVSDANYKNELSEKVKLNGKIVANFEFLPEQQLVDQITAADIVVIPFADTLTSGSTILAMTQGKPLILPEKARVFGCVPEPGVKYFANIAELTSVLQNIHTLPLQAMATTNRAAALNLTWEKVGALTKQCYS
ncbi:glycosyltransferase [Paraglaciecola marina]|uniref:glycosyltransferase n=1 Tax=Paraglaciecola marina TaxID=2500157 RepID=UPI001414F24A|nr:glycosyltransferase [Paraglaciecola marina]